MPSFILIHPPCGHNTPPLQTGQTGQDRQRSDSIGRTVLEMVAQNYFNDYSGELVDMSLMAVTKRCS